MPGRLPATLALGGLLATAGSLGAYPLDGAERTGIRRLSAQAEIQRGERPGRKLPNGALLGWEDVRLHLAAGIPGGDLGRQPKDPTLQAAISSIFQGRDPSYSVVVVDVTDPKDVRWAGVNEHRRQYAGSVGKITTMIALFDGLARAFPDVARRQAVLRDTVITATDWAAGDSHSVPQPSPPGAALRTAAVQPGQSFTLAEWVDHMISASANSAGTVVWREAMLLRAHGDRYPLEASDATRFFESLTPGQRRELALAVVNEPLAAAALDLDSLKQGTLWTRPAQAKIPGSGSHASAHELARLLLRLEEGRLVDSWSSLEMKRYLYSTRKRYRYGFAPELSEAALYFKSGSLYACRQEEGFRCGKYAGNEKNFMNSVAIVESPARASEGQRRYVVALLSNVLRVNSAWDHARIGAAIEEAVRTRSKTAIRYAGSEADIATSGKSE